MEVLVGRFTGSCRVVVVMVKKNAERERERLREHNKNKTTKPIHKRGKNDRRKREEETHTLLHNLDILKTNPNPPDAPQMPTRLPRQVLHHNAAEDHEFRLDLVQDAVVGEVEAVGDFY